MELMNAVPVSFPLTKCSLWDHSKQGKTISISNCRNMQLEIGSNVSMLVQRAVKESSGPTHCLLTGSLIHDSDGDSLEGIIDRLSMADDSGLGSMSSPPMMAGDLNIPCLITIKDDLDFFGASNYVASLKLIHHQCCSNKPMDISDFMLMKAMYNYNIRDNYMELTVDLITVATHFKATPVMPVPIIPTALSKNLMGPLNYGEVQGEPKMGYLTMDHTRKLLLVLQTDPKVQTLPIVGIWMTGIKYIYDPFVWCCCLRYLNNHSIQDRVCLPPEPFLAIIISSLHSKPQFFEVLPAEYDGKLDFQLNTSACRIPCDTADQPVILDFTKVEVGPKLEDFRFASSSLYSKIHENELQGKSLTERSIAEDIMPRLTPSPHQTKESIFQSQVPDVSFLIEDSPHKELYQKVKSKATYIAGEPMSTKQKQAQLSKNDSLSTGGMPRRMPLKLVNRDLNNVNNQPKGRSNIYNYSSVGEQENIGTSLTHSQRKHSLEGMPVNTDIKTSQKTTDNTEKSISRNVSMKNHHTNYHPHPSQHQLPQQRPPFNYPGHSKQNFPAWNPTNTAAHQVHVTNFLPNRYPVFIPQPGIPNAPTQPRCYGNCLPTCRHPHFQYRPPGMGYSNSPPQNFGYYSPYYNTGHDINTHHLNNNPGVSTNNNSSNQPNNENLPATKDEPKTCKEKMQPEINDNQDMVSLSSDEMYKKILDQDHQLKQLREQLQKLLATQNANENKTAENTAQALKAILSSPITKKCTIATNTSLLWNGSPTRVKASATFTKNTNRKKLNKQLSMTELNETEMNQSFKSAKVDDEETNSEQTDNESMTFSIQMTALPDDSSIDSSVVSQMIVDIPSYESSTRSFTGTTLNESPVIESVSMYDDTTSDKKEITKLNEIVNNNDDNAGYYKNLLGRINQLLDGSTSADNMVTQSSPNEFKGLADTFSGCEKEVAIATLEQLRKMGIELPSENDMSINQTFVNVETAVLHKINYVSMMFDEHSETDLSMQVNSLAMKYLNKDQADQMSNITTSSTNQNTVLQHMIHKTHSPNVTLCGMSTNDLSFASKKYMEKYGLLEKTNMQIREQAESTLFADSRTESSELMKLPWDAKVHYAMTGDETIKCFSTMNTGSNGQSVVNRPSATVNTVKPYNSVNVSTSTMKTESTQITSSTGRQKSLDKFPLLSAIKLRRRDLVSDMGGNSYESLNTPRDEYSSFYSNISYNERCEVDNSRDSEDCLTDIVRPPLNEHHIVSTPKDRNVSIHEPCEIRRGKNDQSICSSSHKSSKLVSSGSGSSEIDATQDSVELEKRSGKCAIKVFDKSSKEFAKNPLPIMKSADAYIISVQKTEEAEVKILDIHRLKQLPKLL